MGFFVDNFDDCIKKYENYDRAGDDKGAESALLKAFTKEHDENYEGSLYYLLSLTQFNQDKNELALSNMQNSANLGYPEAEDFISEVYEDEDEGINLDTILKKASSLLIGANALMSLLSE